MNKKIIILENLPNNISYVAREIDKEGNERYFYRHLDWLEPYCNGIKPGDEFFLIDRNQVDEPGIIMHGFIASEVTLTPVYWAEKGISRVYLKDVQIVNPKKYRLLTIASMQAVMHGQIWDLIRSGWILCGPAVPKIREMWKMYLEMNDGFR